MRKYSILLVAAALLVLASPALAGTITDSNTQASSGLYNETFDDLCAGLNAYDADTAPDEYNAPDDVYEGWYADFAETFEGLSVDKTGTFESFTMPTAGYSADDGSGGLTLADPDTEDGIIGLKLGSDGALGSGIALNNGSDDDGTVGLGTIGEGVVSIQFDWGQTEMGIDLLYIDDDGAEIQFLFWNKDGSLFDEVVVTPGAASKSTWSFTTGGTDVFYGVSIANNDEDGSAAGNGIGFDNLRYGAPVPEPTTIALFGLGIAGVAAHRRRQKA